MVLATCYTFRASSAATSPALSSGLDVPCSCRQLTRFLGTSAPAWDPTGRNSGKTATVLMVDLGEGRQAMYEVIGEGLPTPMLPGGPGFSSAYMRGTARLFADELKSHMIDPYGSGGSTPPTRLSEYSAVGHARFYGRCGRHSGWPSVTVFGHPFGATTALTYAALYPEVVERCIAVAAFGVGTEHDEAEGGDAAAEMDAR
jgi:pimeloyl-ACP methyl ester carboxylesterase